MKKSLFSRWFNRSAKPEQALTTEDIRRKLASYQKQEGPATFAGAQLYGVEEVEQTGKFSSLVQPQERERVEQG